MPSTTLLRSIGYCGLFGSLLAAVVIRWAYWGM